MWMPSFHDQERRRSQKGTPGAEGVEDQRRRPGDGEKRIACGMVTCGRIVREMLADAIASLLARGRGGAF